jgi:hypothetical protein
MSDTPESGEIRHLKTALEETAKLAATLKRERDEAIRQRNETNESSKYAVEHAERERDEARIQEDIHYQNYLQMQRERDKAREQLAIAKAERNAAHLKCHRIAEEIMAWLADPQPNNTTPPATSK